MLQYIIKIKKFILLVVDFHTEKRYKINEEKDLLLGFCLAILQAACMSYFIGYVMIANTGYQAYDPVESAVITKVKGVAYTNFSKEDFNELIQENYKIYQGTWDAADYIIPPSENNALFVLTNVVLNPNQRLNTCPEDPEVPGARCITDADCKAGLHLMVGNGVLTGKCITSDVNHTLHVCEINSWCPVERDVYPLKDGRALLYESRKFTLLIKNFVNFPKYGIQRRNFPEYENDSQINCRYHKVNDPLCPIFVLEDIVPGNYGQIAVKGGVVAIIINWDCNFDYGTDCFPTYEFRRIDQSGCPIAEGVNFRFANYHSDVERDFYKAYGIKFIIMVQGRGRKFDIKRTLLHVGALLGILAMAKSVSLYLSILVFKPTRKAYTFVTNTFRNVNPDERRHLMN